MCCLHKGLQYYTYTMGTRRGADWLTRTWTVARLPASHATMSGVHMSEFSECRSSFAPWSRSINLRCCNTFMHGEGASLRATK